VIIIHIHTAKLATAVQVNNDIGTMTCTGTMNMAGLESSDGIVKVVLVDFLSQIIPLILVITFRQHAELVNISLADRVWHVPLGRSRAPLAMEDAAPVRRTHTLPLGVLLQAAACATLDTLDQTEGVVQRVLLASTKKC
jgi:hypothetical protein